MLPRGTWMSCTSTCTTPRGELGQSVLDELETAVGKQSKMLSGTDMTKVCCLHFKFEEFEHIVRCVCPV